MRVGVREQHGGTYHWWLVRLSQLVLFFPIGYFLIIHLVSHSFVARQSISLPEFLWIGFIAVCVLFYIVMGCFKLATSSVNVFSYGSYDNWMYFFHRVTFVIAVPFVVYRSLTFRSPSQVQWMLMVGMTATVFHVVSGMAQSLTDFGITVSLQSRRACAVMMWIAFFILTGFGLP